MSYDDERKVLANFANAQSFFGLSPFGLDGDPVELANDSGFMTILNGEGIQASTGCPGANLHDYVGILLITFVTRGESGAGGATEFIDAIIDLLTGLKLDETGAAPSAGSTMVIDFGRGGFVPSVQSKTQEAPWLRTVISAPFVRTERK